MEVYNQYWKIYRWILVLYKDSVPGQLCAASHPQKGPQSIGRWLQVSPSDTFEGLSYVLQCHSEVYGGCTQRDQLAWSWMVACRPLNFSWHAAGTWLGVREEMFPDLKESFGCLSACSGYSDGLFCTVVSLHRALLLKLDKEIFSPPFHRGKQRCPRNTPILIPMFIVTGFQPQVLHTPESSAVSCMLHSFTISCTLLI